LIIGGGELDITKDSSYTIGLITGPVDLMYSQNITRGVWSECAQNNVRLITYVIVSNNVEQSIREEVLSLIDAQDLDGLIYCGTIQHDLLPDTFQKVLDDFVSIPTATISFTSPGSDAILVNNRVGMSLLMDHLLDDHGYRRIAFMGGPKGQEESETRKEIFIRALERRGCEVPPEWIVHGDFTQFSGKGAVQELLQLKIMISRGLSLLMMKWPLPPLIIYGKRGIGFPRICLSPGMTICIPTPLPQSKPRFIYKVKGLPKT